MKNKCGIYRWTNLIDGKLYIGSSQNLGKRINYYFNISEYCKKNYICSALKKHGYYNFSLIILEYCDPCDKIYLEQFFMDLYKPEYNILKIAYSRSGHKLSDETKNKISISSNKKEVIQKKVRMKYGLSDNQIWTLKVS